MNEGYAQKDLRDGRLSARWCDGKLSVRASGPRPTVLDLMERLHDQHGGPDPRQFTTEPIPGQMEFLDE